jgi:hypothetical protein
MEYRGIRYTLRAGIERGQWSVIIYPQGVETTGIKVFGTREDAEHRARHMIKKNGWSRDPSEDQFGRQDSRRYSGWTTGITIAVIVIVFGIVILVYQLKY